MVKRTGCFDAKGCSDPTSPFFRTISHKPLFSELKITISVSGFFIHPHIQILHKVYNTHPSQNPSSSNLGI